HTRVHFAAHTAENCTRRPTRPAPSLPRPAAVRPGRDALGRHSPTPTIAPLTFRTTASAIPVSEKPPLAFTTPAINTATSSTRPPSPPVPSPPVSATARATRAWARPTSP